MITAKTAKFNCATLVHKHCCYSRECFINLLLKQHLKCVWPGVDITWQEKTSMFLPYFILRFLTCFVLCFSLSCMYGSNRCLLTIPLFIWKVSSRKTQTSTTFYSMSFCHEQSNCDDIQQNTCKDCIRFVLYRIHIVWYIYYISLWSLVIDID